MPLKNISRRLRITSGGDVQFGEAVYEPGGTFGPRRQPHYQLVLVRTGEATVWVDGTRRTVGSGQVTLLRPGAEERFAMAAQTRTHHTWCALPPVLVDRETVAAVTASPTVQAVTPELAQLIELGLALSGRAAEPAPGLVQALGWAALQEYLFAGAVGGTAGVGSPALQRALDWIGRHGTEPLDLQTLAQRAGVSPAQLVKLFRREVGDTPMRLVWRARTAQGVQLLQSTGLTVAEIADRCGFKTAFHFSRRVKADHGVSPRAVRAQAWRMRQA